MRRTLWIVLVAAPLPLWVALGDEPAAVLASGGTVCFSWLSLPLAVGLALHLIVLATLAWVLLARPTPRTLRRVGFGAGGAALGVVLALALGEVALRWRAEHLPRSLTRYLGAPPFRLSESSYYLYDGPWKFRGQPGLDLPARSAEGEFVREGRIRQHPLAEEPEEVALRLDADGFRNAAVPERVDVVCAGDSFTFGWNLPREASWPALLEGGGRSTYSVAVNAYAPSQELAVLEAFGLPKAPRAVVWALFEGNDVADEEGFLAARDAPPPAEASAEPTPLRGVHLLGLARWLGDALPRGLVDHAAAPRDPPLGSVGGRELPLAVSPTYLRNLFQEPAWGERAGLASIREAVRAAKARCAERGARLLVVLIPSKAHVLVPLLEPAARDALFAQTLREEFAALRDARPAGVEPEAWRAQVSARIAERFDRYADALLTELEAILRDEGVTSISLLPVLRDAYLAGEPPYFALDSHWNRAGHRVAAEAVTQWLDQAR